MTIGLPMSIATVNPKSGRPSSTSGIEDSIASGEITSMVFISVTFAGLSLIAAVGSEDCCDAGILVGVLLELAQHIP